MKFFDINTRRLIFFFKSAKNEFWDQHWFQTLDKFKNSIYKFNPKSIVCKITPKFLFPDDGPILEGGCGLGQNILCLQKMKYDAIGIDYAKHIIEKVNRLVPSLKIKVGDIRYIQYPDNFFAGYWSFGVIEHYFEGYDEILKEMKRVIKKGGYLFISFPYLSPFRNLKLKFNLYRVINSRFLEKRKLYNYFYQFALEKEEVIKVLNLNGFELKHLEPLGGLKGFKDEVFFLKFFIKRFLQMMYDAERPKFIQIFKSFFDRFFSLFAAHTILLIFQKI
ncbi:MAG: methyltransferase domain-containing protein [Promethearchaeota archaeon]